MLSVMQFDVLYCSVPRHLLGICGKICGMRNLVYFFRVEIVIPTNSWTVPGNFADSISLAFYLKVEK